MRGHTKNVGNTNTPKNGDEKGKSATAVDDCVSSNVAIIGGGISGLALAHRLSGAGIKCAVFDTGKVYPGGRCSSRVFDNSAVAVDHACQVFRGFTEGEAQELLDAGIVRRVDPKTEVLNLEYCLGQNQKKEGKQFRTRTVTEGGNYNAAVEGNKADNSNRLADIKEDVLLLPTSARSAAATATNISSDETRKNPKTVRAEAGGGAIAHAGVAALPQYLVNSCPRYPLHLKTWISEIYFAKDHWLLKENQTWRKEKYTHLVIAHCGKCATRLIDTAWIRHSQIASKYLKCRFVSGDEASDARRKSQEEEMKSETVKEKDNLSFDFDPAIRGSNKGKGKGKAAEPYRPSSNKLDILSQFSIVLETNLGAGVGTTLPAPQGASSSPWLFNIENHPVLKTVANNSRKYGQKKDLHDHIKLTGKESTQFWTILTTPEFASKHKCPQENIPNDVFETVTTAVCRAFREFCTNLPDAVAISFGFGSSTVADKNVDFDVKVRHLQLWGAALPANQLPVTTSDSGATGGFLYEAEHRLGVVGDWLCGNNIGAAFRSGRAFADALVATHVGGADLLTTANLSADNGKGVPFVSCSSRSEDDGKARKNVAAISSSADLRKELNKPTALRAEDDIVTEQARADGADEKEKKPRTRGRGRWNKGKAPANANCEDAETEEIDAAAATKHASSPGDLQSGKKENSTAQPPRPNSKTKSDVLLSSASSTTTTRPNTDWKWAIRHRIWDYLEKHNLAEFPRPVHHRIPNFKNAAGAAEQILNIPEFIAATVVKVNPDTPQKQIRFNTLKQNKTLLVPQPRLLKGFFSKITPAILETWRRENENSLSQALAYVSTSGGANAIGKRLDFDEISLKVDLVVIGSVAVNPENGARIGKGEGFAEIEYGVLRMMGQIDENTPVLTHVHDCQLCTDIPPPPGKKQTDDSAAGDEGRVGEHAENALLPEKSASCQGASVPGSQEPYLLPHDVCVDIILTPTKVIRIPREKKAKPQPTGIYWDLLSKQKLEQVKVLRDLKQYVQSRLGPGETLPVGPDEVLPPTAIRGQFGGGGGKKGKGKKK